MPLTADGNERLDRFVARKMPDYSRTRIVQAIKQGEVKVEGKVITKPSHELKPDQIIEVGKIPEPEPHNLEPADIPLDVRYEDDYMLVVNKPRGMSSHPAPGLAPTTLVNALLFRSHDLSQAAGEFRPGIVHRLDKATTGLMLVAKNDFAHRKLADQIKEKTAERRYFAIVKGTPEHKVFKIDAPIGRHPGIPTLMAVRDTGKQAVTHVKTITRLEQGTLVACRLETGRTHQIRVHLSSFGHPIKGDPQYSKLPWSSGPLQLHAAYLSFDHPDTGARLTVYAEPPHDFVGRDDSTREDVENWA
ncbi:MAG: RluA family pseudouridine synthase [Armatimonadetes bacterium]|nr:RluA family pseudouridine synthase [Armatimonadota bacterium]